MSNEILSGQHAVLEVLRAGRRTVEELFALPDRVAEVRKILGGRKVKMHETTPAALLRLAGTDCHQGLAARVAPYPYVSLDQVLTKAMQGPRGGFLLLLDQVQDPQNFGAVVRTAHCAGVHGMIVPKDHSAPITGAVCRAAAGATEHMLIAQVTNLVQAINTLKSNNIWVVGAEGGAPQSLYEYAFDSHHAIVMGTEGKGLRRLVRESCDILLSIPMEGAIGSYNVSAAAAMILGEVLRQRLDQKSRKTP
ncbi:MAG: 23S rRNA (guanosine(2251)-2'-O)-methyltransferase RlmB [Deltaproteobacteria bacterium]|nr:23S rRNA (guanosine(2251)-2'-O)-methyltransferase RlmB [Deltaproteobacteria bacterium]